MDVTFNSIEELYNRIKPVLKTKKMELSRNGLTYIKEIDIWNYLRENKWNNSKNLYLCEMVSEILNCDNLEIDNYVKDKLKLRGRKAYFEE